MTQRTLLFLLILFVGSVFFACNHEDTPEPPTPDPEPEQVRRTVLVYQVANRNGLLSNSKADLAEMCAAAADGAIPADGRLLVYSHRDYEDPVLIEVKSDRLDTLSVYSSDLPSVDRRRMLSVFADMADYAPADGYGLILWGHGSGWIENGIEQPVMRSYGGDNGKWMNVSDLAATLADADPFEYLYFDCCYMGGVEVAYELEPVVPYVAFSVMEIAAEGMPYNLTIGHFFNPDPYTAVSQAAKTTVDYYREWEQLGSRPECNPASFLKRYCTMSVVATDRLDALAEAVRPIYYTTPDAAPAGMNPLDYGRSPYAALYYDFGRYIADLCFDGDSERYPGASAHYAAFKDALANAVPFHDEMDCVFGTTRAITDGSGLSTFILRTPSDADKFNYTTLRWYDQVAICLTRDY